MTWFAEAANLRRFALWNIFFWLSQHAVVTAWYITRPDDFGGIGLGGFYLIHISVAALWLSALAWWQSTRIEVTQEQEAAAREAEDPVEDKVVEAIVAAPEIPTQRP